MSPEDIAAAVVFLALIVYALFGGADFGGGVWTALASGPRAAQQRQAILRAMGPVWETNHVWLIAIVVTLFTAFPSAFADLFTALLIPLMIALVGIIFRGASFAFRHYGYGAGAAFPASGIVFSVASIIAPLTMGMALGAIVGGHIRIENGAVTSGLYEPWLRPFSIICGLMAVAMCSFLTTYYMTVRSSGQLQEDFRKRGLLASLVLGALTMIAIPIAYWDADPFWDRLLGPAPLTVMVSAVALELASVVVLWRRWYLLAPPVAAGTVALVIAGWAAVQHPYFIPPDERISEVAAPNATLVPLLIGLAIGALILIPSLVLLYLTFSEKTGGPDVEGKGYGY